MKGRWRVGIGDLALVGSRPLSPGPLPVGRGRRIRRAAGAWALGLGFRWSPPQLPGPLPGGEERAGFEGRGSGGWDLALLFLGPLAPALG